MNEMKNYIIILLLAMLFQPEWSAVAGELPSVSNFGCPVEKIVVHFSQECLLTGEVLFFKIYCTSDLYPATNISSVSFIELVSSDNKPVVRKKILLEHGEGAGDIEIPASLATGTYYFIAYTSWMKNFGEESFFKDRLLIINPYQPLITSSGDHDTVSMIPCRENVPGTNDKLLLLSEKKQFGKREKICIRLDNSDTSSFGRLEGFSVSVCRKEPGFVTDIGQPESSSGKQISTGRIILPDHNGIVLSGKLYNPAGDPEKNAAIILSFPGRGTHLSRIFTGSNGEFNYLLKPGTGEDDIIFRLPDSETRMSLDESFWNGFRAAPENRPPYFDSAALSNLRQTFDYFQLQNLFRHYYERYPEEKVPGDSSSFYSKPYSTFYIKNYVALDSISEYFYELMPSVKFTKKEGLAGISVYDEQSAGYLSSGPGLFLDGVLMKNKTSILDLPVADVDRITLLPADYLYKDFEFGGIIDVHTRASDFKSAVLEPDMTRLLYPKAASPGFKFLPVDYSTADRGSRNPDLRYLLLWNPWMLAAETTSNIEFYSGDIEGIFTVKVTGITSKGKIVHAETEIIIGS
jgi:hypothetical protein